MEKIICTNEGCHKEFDKPIEIFDGSLVCPRCLRIIRLERFLQPENAPEPIAVTLSLIAMLERAAHPANAP